MAIILLPESGRLGACGNGIRQLVGRSNMRYMSLELCDSGYLNCFWLPYLPWLLFYGNPLGLTRVLP